MIAGTAIYIPKFSTITEIPTTKTSDSEFLLQKKIENDAKQSKGKKLLIYLGDYIDRGPAIKDCVQSLIDFKPPNFTVVYLLGNHEQMLLDFVEGSFQKKWIYF